MGAPDAWNWGGFCRVLLRRVAQGHRRGVRQDVDASELQASRAHSAVFLVHAESLRQAPGGSTGTAAAGRLSVEDRRLSHGECERLVTWGTELHGRIEFGRWVPGIESRKVLVAYARRDALDSIQRSAAANPEG